MTMLWETKALLAIRPERVQTDFHKIVQKMNEAEERHWEPGQRNWRWMKKTENISVTIEANEAFL